MDKYNVISLTSDLSELEVDMTNWLNMPYDIRLRSDEDCIRLYNMTNIDLYNDLKSSIISNKITQGEDLDEIGKFISESAENIVAPEFISNKESEEELEQLINMSDNTELNNPYIVIIRPFTKNHPYTFTELNQKYQAFGSLNSKNKMYSNYYSCIYWGYNVPDMYNIMYKKLLNMGNPNKYIEESAVVEEPSVYTKTQKYIKEHNIDKMIVERDIIGLLLTKLQSCDPNLPISESGFYSHIEEDIDNALYYNDISIPEIVPYFTPDEMDQFIVDEPDINPNNYLKELKAAYEAKDTNRLLSLGWNPSIEPTIDNMKFAKSRQLKWIKEHGCRIIDISHLNIPEYISESSTNMKVLYNSRELYPVYIVLSFTDTFFGNVIRKIKNCDYSHAGLCLDSNLKDIYTFNFALRKYSGFTVDSLQQYIDKSDKAVIDVLCIFVDKKTRLKLEATLKDFISLRAKTRYGFGNILNILFNRAKNYPYPENLHLVCSQFVNTVLKIANIDLVSDRLDNLVIPQDFERICVNPKVFKVFEGSAKDYSETRCENQIKLLFDTKPRKYMEYNHAIELAVKESNFNIYTDNEAANNILEQLQYYLTPEAVIFEKNIPVQIKDDGTVTIELVKSLEDEYQEAHKLLTSYNSNNLEGIKHELARLFYVNSVIEGKIKKMKRNDENYKSLTDLRARVLNDFKKYFKVVSEAEPDFDFNAYYKNSEYYNGNITISGSTLKYSGKLIGKILGKILGYRK